MIRIISNAAITEDEISIALTLGLDAIPSCEHSRNRQQHSHDEQEFQSGNL